MLSIALCQWIRGFRWPLGSTAGGFQSTDIRNHRPKRRNNFFFFFAPGKMVSEGASGGGFAFRASASCQTPTFAGLPHGLATGVGTRCTVRSYLGGGVGPRQSEPERHAATPAVELFLTSALGRVSNGLPVDAPLAMPPPPHTHNPSALSRALGRCSCTRHGPRPFPRTCVAFSDGGSGVQCTPTHQRRLFPRYVVCTSGGGGGGGHGGWQAHPNPHPTKRWTPSGQTSAVWHRRSTLTHCCLHPAPNPEAQDLSGRTTAQISDVSVGNFLRFCCFQPPPPASVLHCP